MKRLDLTGQRFGSLLVVGSAPDVTAIGGTRKRIYPTWKCLCDCGAEREIRGENLVSGQQSCGCLGIERLKKMFTKHGMTDSAEYRIWEGMWTRITNTKCRAFKHYGGRGITACEEWRSFENFFADMGHRPAGGSLERKNNDGPYSPENCVWATAAEQSNNKRNNLRLVLDGTVKTTRQWAESTGIPYSAIWQRVQRMGWTVRDSLSIPVRRSAA